MNSTSQPVTASVSLALLLLLTTFASARAQESAEVACDVPARYTFSWNMHNDCEDRRPRGGNTKGPEVTLDPQPHPGWLAIQAVGQDKALNEEQAKKARDRRAILAMAGPYRASFEFLEVVGYTADYERSRPYQSWATEYIYVIEDSENFISLQHILVMFLIDEAGQQQGPFVQKHWRQDWRYAADDMLSYDGNNVWSHKPLSSEQRQGAWVQEVYQVDDSPRYGAYGRWVHQENVSTWESSLTWRPLPRRESSVRDDYQVLEGYNRHTITPTGWVHEEENYKVVLDDAGQKIATEPYLAKELGLNRYERIKDFDFSAGDAYWEESQSFWSVVREGWAQHSRQGETLSLALDREGPPLFVVLFELQEAFSADAFDSQELTRRLEEEVFGPYVE